MQRPSPLTVPDDVIQRLAPSLAQYIGCTIIDVNPGIGLWSSRLHDHLKPRNHILIEPRKDVYLPSLQPLLDAPGSRYQLRDWPDANVFRHNRYVEEGLLHDAEGHGGLPPTTKEPNNSILVIANAMGQRHKIIEEARVTNSAHIKVIDYANAVRHQAGLQRYGQTRMLMWLSDEDKRSLLPRTVGYRGRLASLVESFFHLEEIVGFPHASDSKIKREDALDIESGKRVAKRMQEKDIKIPPHRQFRLEDRRFDLSEVSRQWHKELQELQEGFRAGKFSQYLERPAADSDDERMRKAKNNRIYQVYTPEYKRLTKLRNVSTGQNKTLDKINRILKGQERIDNMYVDLHREDIEPSEQDEIIKALDSSIQDYKQELGTLTEKQLTALFFLDDDRRAFAMDPPLLLWDRREAEPLLAREDEFHSPGQNALLDFQPKKTNEFPMNTEESIYFDLVSTHLFGPRGQTTLKYLKTIAPGAFEALVPQVPAIRDPRRGGRYDIDSVRVRALTPEMLYGLAVAWDNWAFKPPIEETLAQFSTNFEHRAMTKAGVIAKL